MNGSLGDDRCSVCGDVRGAVHHAREMMYGTRDEFSYLECAGCGCVQLIDPPADPSSYYAADYHALKPPKRGLASPVVDALKRARARYEITGKGFLGRALAARYPATILNEPWVKELVQTTDPSARILDVGCSYGAKLLMLRDLGYRRLAGADPYVAEDIDYGNGVVIQRRELPEVAGAFDVVMLHHSFEHMAKPRDVLAAVERLLEPGGLLLIRVPVIAFAWREYGVDWVQLDAPRHLFLHTEKSLGMLAAEAGFSVEQVLYDSTEFQFFGSEQYRAGIPLRDERSYWVGSPNSPFTPDQISAFRAHAQELNAHGDGDQACFFLRRA